MGSGEDVWGGNHNYLYGGMEESRVGVCRGKGDSGSGNGVQRYEVCGHPPSSVILMPFEKGVGVYRTSFGIILLRKEWRRLGKRGGR